MASVGQRAARKARAASRDDSSYVIVMFSERRQRRPAHALARAPRVVSARGEPSRRRSTGGRRRPARRVALGAAHREDPPPRRMLSDATEMPAAACLARRTAGRCSAGVRWNQTWRRESDGQRGVLELRGATRERRPALSAGCAGARAGAAAVLSGRVVVGERRTSNGGWRRRYGERCASGGGRWPRTAPSTSAPSAAAALPRTTTATRQPGAPRSEERGWRCRLVGSRFHAPRTAPATAHSGDTCGDVHGGSSLQ